VKPALVVERVYEGKHVVHWRVSRGEAGEMVTVRTSDFGVYCCLTCRVIDCKHVEAVREFDHASDAPAIPEAPAA
jgi:hypothetical protein